MVYCKFCCQKVKYGGKGKSLIKRHADSTAHKKKSGAVTMNIHNARHLSCILSCKFSKDFENDNYILCVFIKCSAMYYRSHTGI